MYLNRIHQVIFFAIHRKILYRQSIVSGHASYKKQWKYKTNSASVQLTTLTVAHCGRPRGELSWLDGGPATRKVLASTITISDGLFVGAAMRP